MSLWIDIKYAKIAGMSIDRYSAVRESPYLACGRCRICGDSSQKKKRRFYFYERGGEINAVCHNCGYSTSLAVYLKNEEPSLYKQYAMESFAGSRIKEPVIKVDHTDLFKVDYEKQAVNEYDKIKELPSIWDLSESHKARKYIESRKLPKFDFYYAEEFCNFASQFKDEFKRTSRDHPRIIIPFRDTQNKIYGMQARSINGEEPKYYTLFPSIESPRIFGLDRVKTGKKIYIVEGPLDSLFVPNCIAALSSSLSAASVKCADLLNNNPKDDYVLVYDNQPRNPEIVALYKKSIEEGHSVVIWDKTFKYKDINDAVKDGGMEPIDIFRMIKNNTYRGLEAKLKLNLWKKL